MPHRSAATLLIALLATGPGQAAVAGPYAVQCAACHRSGGQGGPTAPRLAERATVAAGTPAGRSYLIGVLLHGLSGPITVDGRRLDGVMPAYGHLTDAEAASVLNDLLRLGLKSKVQDFTPREVAAQRRLGARTPDAMAAARRRLPPTPGF